MPNITIYIPMEAMPSEQKLAGLTDRCLSLCTDVLLASLKNVHIIYVGVRHGHGHPAFAEVKYRIEPFRTPPVMEQFMAALDEAIKHFTGHTARIRSFGYVASSIHARN